MASTTISEPQETYTLNQFISLRDSDKMMYVKYSILSRSIDHPEMVYAIENVVYNYMDIINSRKKTVIVDQEQKIKYQYKPKLLAYDVYGSTESYFMILACNGMCNLKEFALEEFKFYALTPSDLAAIMSSILNAENKYITMNRSNLEIYES